MMRLHPYREGSVFLVPLRNGGFARGIVARSDPKQQILLGYFFGPHLKTSDTIMLDDLKPKNAILCIRFGALGLQNGEWKNIGFLQGWNRSDWPIPYFARRDPLKRVKTQRVQYSDNDPSRRVEEIPVDDDDGLLTDSLSGYGAVEIKLTKLLRSNT